jgi:hypothetical protein
VFDQIELMQGGSRAAHRAGLGDDQPQELPAAHHEPIEAQIVDDLDDGDVGDLYGYGQPDHTRR